MADRIEREIEEILKKIDDFVPETARRKRPPQKPAGGISSAPGWLARRIASVSLNQVMLWSLLLLFAAFIFKGIPGASWIMLGSLIVLVTAFFLSLRSPRIRNAPPVRWRGELVQYSTEPGWPDRLKAWVKGRKKA